jgi:hypothetical protein
MPSDPCATAALVTRAEVELLAPRWLLQHALDEHLRFCRGCAESNPYLCRGRQYAEELRRRLDA